MKKIVYPITYFRDIWTPRRVFEGRRNMNYFQIVLTFLFLNALLLIPIALKTSSQQAFQFQQMLPTLSQTITNDDIIQIQRLNIKQHHLEETDRKIFSENNKVIIGQHLTKKEVSDHQNVLSFDQDKFIVKDSSGYHFEVYYTDDFSLIDIGTKKQLLKKLEQQWFRQNRGYVTFTMLMLMLNVLLINNFCILLVSAVLLWLARKKDFSSIKTMKESLTLLLNAQGLGTFLAFLIGWFLPDITVMVTFQSAGFILMLIATFLTTHFNEKKIRREVEVTVYEEKTI